MLASSLIKILWLIISLLFSASVFADFLQYKQEDIGERVHFSYQWKDSFDDDHKLSFSYINYELYDPFRTFTAFKPDVLLRFVEFELVKFAETAPQDVFVNVQRSFGSKSLEMTVEADDEKLAEEWLEKLKEREQEARTELLRENFYNELKGPQGKLLGIKPDHVRFIVESTKYLGPVIKGIEEEYDENRITARNLLNFILSFTQSIPYSTLEDRVSSNGRGFSPPTHVLYNNQGDCDSKVALMGALFREFFPKIGLAIIYLDNHALLGVNLPVRSEDLYVTLEGLNYVLMEPAGPALMPIAEIAPSSEGQILSETFSWEKVPLLID